MRDFQVEHFARREKGLITDLSCRMSFHFWLQPLASQTFSFLLVDGWLPVLMLQSIHLLEAAAITPALSMSRYIRHNKHGRHSRHGVSRSQDVGHVQ